jgi:hypothetical protein
MSDTSIMRMVAPFIALAAFAGCTDEPSVKIIAPLPDSTIVASVELRMEGRYLSSTTETKIYIDLQQHTGDLVDNTLPDECERCDFVIAFAGNMIPNGEHIIAVYFYAGEETLANDALPVVFAR